jgi:hypothetical protein
MYVPSRRIAIPSTTRPQGDAPDAKRPIDAPRAAEPTQSRRTDAGTPSQRGSTRSRAIGPGDASAGGGS